jgi:2-polyprenyl-3-methyl-5-hydroxy-6-metoxy-1,4-benzoquinol methylase
MLGVLTPLTKSNFLMNINTQKNYWPQDRWDSGNSNVGLAVACKSDIVRKFIEQWIPMAEKKTCFELGCYPGQFLGVFGELGYSLNGIDLSPEVLNKLPEWLQNCGFSVGNFAQADIWDYTPNVPFNVVCSFGLIEHFENWGELIRRHIEMCAKGGLVVITTPNFRGKAQLLMRTLVDGDNLRGHNLDAMRPDAWREVAVDMGCKVLYSGYIGNFDFWMGMQKRNFVQKVAGRLFRWLRRIRFMLPDSSMAFSPYCGIVIQK